MTRRFDTWARVALLVVAIAAVIWSFVLAADTDLDRSERFVWLSVLTLVVVHAGSPALDLVQGYTKRSPLRPSWGKPRAEIGPPRDEPTRVLPNDWQIDAAVRLSPAIAALSGTAALAVIFGAVSYAIAGSPMPDGRGLVLFLLFAVALSQTFLAARRLMFRRNALTVTPDQATLGVSLGYIPPLVIPRSAVDAIETSTKRQIVAFITIDRRYEISTSMLDAEAVRGQLAGLWPETPWHDLSSVAIRTKVGEFD